MRAQIKSDPNRHYKTLIALVLSMTCVTLFLFWLANVTPVTPLRGKVGAAPTWDRISVRAEKEPGAERGFFHFRIDEQGRLFQTSAWKGGVPSPVRRGTIHILLSNDNPLNPPTVEQTQTLSRTIKELRTRFKIGVDQVLVDRGEQVARAG